METQKTTCVIFNFFAADHDRLDAYFNEFVRLKKTDFPLAKTYFKSFLKGLKRHIVWEEEVLFLFFEKKSRMADSGPTRVMREEHRLIHSALDLLHDKVRRADAGCDAEVQRLTDILGQHNFKEENILYPAIDQMVQEGEAAAVFQALENIPEDRFEGCCGTHS